VCQLLISAEFDFDGARTPDWPSPAVNFASTLSNELAIIANLMASNKLRATSHVIETERTSTQATGILIIIICRCLSLSVIKAVEQRHWRHPVCGALRLHEIANYQMTHLQLRRFVFAVAAAHQLRTHPHNGVGIIHARIIYIKTSSIKEKNQ
jgi:hypothetical protein